MALYDPTFLHDYWFDRPSVEEVALKDDEIGFTFGITTPDSIIYGIKIFSAKAGAHTIRVKLYIPGNAVAVKNQDFAFAGAGTESLLWTTPYTVTESDMAAQIEATNFGVNRFMISLYDPDNVSHTWWDGTPQTGYGTIRCSVGWCYIVDGTTAGHCIVGQSVGGEGRPDAISGVLASHLPCSPLIAPPALTYEPTPQVYCYGGENASVQLTAASHTRGQPFWVLTEGLLYGVRFYTHDPAVHDMKCSIWKPNNTLAASKTVTCTGAGTYEALFDTPYRVTQADFRLWDARAGQWIAGVFNNNSKYTEVTSASGTIWWYDGAWISYPMLAFKTGYGFYYAAGDAIPWTAGAGRAPVAPLAWADNLVI